MAVDQRSTMVISKWNRSNIVVYFLEAKHKIPIKDTILEGFRDH